ncbi:MAG: hypothetical protein ACRDNN_03795 [Gaiellaceae bacterium]
MVESAVASIVETARPADVKVQDERPAKPDRQQRKEAMAAARRQRKEAKAAERAKHEEAQAAARKEKEEAQEAARQVREEAQAAARKEREETQAAVRKKREEELAAARKEKEQAEAAARKAREEEEKARQTPEEDVTDRDENDRPETQALATATAAASATARVEPDRPDADEVGASDTSSNEEKRQIRADAKSAARGDAEERKAARAAAAAAAEEKMRAKKEARKHRADAKHQAKEAKAQAKREAKEAKREAKNRPKDHIDDSRTAQAEKADAEFLKSLRESKSAATSMGGHAAAAPSVSERALVEAAEATETDTSEVEKVEKVDEPSPAPISHDAGAHREPMHEETQPIGRVQVDDDVPDAEPKERRAGVRAAAVVVAALVGALGLTFSVVLAVGALTVAIGAGEGNAIYDLLSTVCDALAGPLKNAFSFTGPNAASREEFLGWGAGSLIYLAVSFAGQAAHRAATRD